MDIKQVKSSILIRGYETEVYYRTESLKQLTDKIRKTIHDPCTTKDNVIKAIDTTRELERLFTELLLEVDGLKP